MKTLATLLIVQIVLSPFSVARANDGSDSATEELSVTLSLDEKTPVTESRFLPLGQMLVNRKTQEGLTLACRAFDEIGRCSRFQFAYFPNAQDLQTHSWASPVFRMTDGYSDISGAEQQAKLRKWIRKKVSAPRMTGTQRGIIGFMTFWAGTLTIAMLQTGKTVRGDSVDWLGAFVFGGMFAIGALGADRLDLISPFFTRPSGALIGIKTEEAGAMSENYLLKQTSIRDRVFKRIRYRIAAHHTYDESKWVARTTFDRE